MALAARVLGAEKEKGGLSKAEMLKPTNSLYLLAASFIRLHSSEAFRPFMYRSPFSTPLH